MLEVDNFLVVFSLEVGGKFIGFFALITNVIVITLAFLLLIGVSIDKDFEYLRQKIEEMEISTFNLPEATNTKAMKQLREYVIVSLVLLMIISAIYIIAGYLLVRGTNNRNHRQVKPAKNILAFLSIFSAFGLVMKLTINSMLSVIIYIYLFAVINSLWKKFKEEPTTEPRSVAQPGFIYPVAVVEPKV